MACKRERETVILRQFTWRCYTKHWKAKSTRIVFGLIDKANNYITCCRSCCSIFFTVVLWNVTFFGFFKTCKFFKKVMIKRKNATLKKRKISTLKAPHSFFVISYKPKVWLGFFCYFLFIYKRTPPLLLHMNRNQMTLMSRNVIDFNFIYP